MSRDQNGSKQRRVVYVNLFFWILLFTMTSCINGLTQNLQYESSLSPQNREKRQQLPFSLDQIFQINAAELGSETQVDIEDDFSFIPNGSENGVMDTQDGDTATEVQRQPPQRQLSQVVSNLIEAAAVQQPPTPQQLVRTVMNSGLRR